MLQRRHPDMIWSADTVKGGRVLFLLEFQRTVERLMALRTTTYTALTLEGIAAGADFRAGDPLPEFVYLVLYHGDGPWTAPARPADLFQRSDPSRYRLVEWGKGTADDPSQDDLTALVLGLARSLSVEDMAKQIVGPANRRRKTRGSGAGRIHAPDHGHDVNVEGLPRGIEGAWSRGPKRIAMKLHYYPETDSLYIEFNEKPGVETREVSDGVNVDIDAHGNLVGFDIDRASNRLDLSSLETTALPIRSYRIG